jgi:hypothetical protein
VLQDSIGVWRSLLAAAAVAATVSRPASAQGVLCRDHAIPSVMQYSLYEDVLGYELKHKSSG